MHVRTYVRTYVHTYVCCGCYVGTYCICTKVFFLDVVGIVGALVHVRGRFVGVNDLYALLTYARTYVSNTCHVRRGITYCAYVCTEVVEQLRTYVMACMHVRTYVRVSQLRRSTIHTHWAATSSSPVFVVPSVLIMFLIFIVLLRPPLSPPVHLVLTHRAYVPCFSCFSCFLFFLCLRTLHIVLLVFPPPPVPTVLLVPPVSIVPKPQVPSRTNQACMYEVRT